MHGLTRKLQFIINKTVWNAKDRWKSCQTTNTKLQNHKIYNRLLLSYGKTSWQQFNNSKNTC